ncbi:MAG: hypothetical protein methR_P0830 [Methyloprofundus sp.]|nr:MAG: hypothetical protein methR_P0830 [Methyloprofundus sp.]
MSIKVKLTKTIIKMTPNKLIIWVANIVLKDIAALTSFNFDIDTRTAFTQVQLVGESETIDVWIDGFAVVTGEGEYHFVIEAARSNRIWLGNILSRIVGKNWKIPVLPQTAPYMEFIAELFKANDPEQEED